MPDPPGPHLKISRFVHGAFQEIQANENEVRYKLEALECLDAGPLTGQVFY